ncbi:MAG: SDR family NAD(P)-dependent oxidoreductase [Campylobacterota bacterium]|nr:SDR family NAD(P)-dependent oxidoreductase [Campylobacterota bacterium]
MPTAIVTGASSGIGKAIALRLLKMDYDVIGISRHIEKSIIEHERFEVIQSDLSSYDDTMLTCKKLQQQFNDIEILINAAGFGRFEPHEELKSQTIEAMIHVNLTAPILLSNALLRQLKNTKGYLINITSIEATRSSKFSALYSATKAGLRAFGQSLFEEVRKSDLSVITINPDMTDTAFFDTLRFEPSQEEHSRLEDEDIADAIEQILRMRKGVVVTEYTIRPQRFGILKKSL